MQTLQTEQQLERLRTWCREYSKLGEVAEIGVFQGGSAHVLAEARQPGRWLYLVGNAAMPGTDTSLWPEASVENRCVHVLGTSRDLAAALRTDNEGFDSDSEQHIRLGFVHIDGNHTYPAVLADLEAVTPLVTVGGAIALHDYGERGSDCCGPAAVDVAVTDFLRDHPEWELVFAEDHQGLIVKRAESEE